MDVLFLALVAIIVCFGFVIAFGAPYLPTLRPQIKAALSLAELDASKTLIELGCGDGRVLVAAAKTGATVIGYELNPILVIICWLRLLPYRGRARVVWGNFFTAQWPPATTLFTFLHPKYMSKLDTKIVHYPHKPLQLVSFAFKVPGRPVTQTKKGVFLYDYL